MIMKKFSSKHGSRLDKTANGYRFKMSKKEWQRIGKQAGWLKSAQIGHLEHDYEYDRAVERQERQLEQAEENAYYLSEELLTYANNPDKVAQIIRENFRNNHELFDKIDLSTPFGWTSKSYEKFKQNIDKLLDNPLNNDAVATYFPSGVYDEGKMMRNAVKFAKEMEDKLGRELVTEDEWENFLFRSDPQETAYSTDKTYIGRIIPSEDDKFWKRFLQIVLSD